MRQSGGAAITRAEINASYDLADRMARSLLLSGISVQEIADLLECHRGSISGWLNRRRTSGGNVIRPLPATLQRWAEITGVPYKWLRDGGRYEWPKPVSRQVRDA